MTAKLPVAIQAILDVANGEPVARDVVVHELVFAFDGIVLTSFESASPIQLPAVGATITVHYSDVTVTDVDLSYTVVDGVQRVTAEVEIEPA